jgi:hypothetical protein
VVVLTGGVAVEEGEEAPNVPEDRGESDSNSVSLALAIANLYRMTT